MVTRIARAPTNVARRRVGRRRELEPMRVIPRLLRAVNVAMPRAVSVARAVSSITPSAAELDSTSGVKRALSQALMRG